MFLEAVRMRSSRLRLTRPQLPLLLLLLLLQASVIIAFNLATV